MQTLFNTNHSASGLSIRTHEKSSSYDDLELDNDELNEYYKAKLENYFAKQRDNNTSPIPEGYISLENAYRQSLKRLNKLYE